MLVLAAEDYTGGSNSPAYASADGPFLELLHRRAGRQRDRRRRLRRRRGGPRGARSARRPRPLRGGGLVHGERPAHPRAGPGRRYRSRKRPTTRSSSVRDYVNEGGKLLYTGQNAAHGAERVERLRLQRCGRAAVLPARRGALGRVPASRSRTTSSSTGWGRTVRTRGRARRRRPRRGVRARVRERRRRFRDDPVRSQRSRQRRQPGSTSTRCSRPRASCRRRRTRCSPPSRGDELDGPTPFDPATGTSYAVAQSDDEGWQRLRKTIDLTGATTGADCRSSSPTTPSSCYDYVIVEAHTVGQDDWTTLPDQNGNTSTDVGRVVRDRLALAAPVPRQLPDGRRRPGPGPRRARPTGTTGEWNGATGNSGGFQEWSIDLSDYAGEQVEISISYVQDFAFSGLGVFVDDAVVTDDGAVVDQTSFETDFGGFEAGPPPAGSEASTQRDWERRGSLGYIAGPGLATEDTLTWGFGFEGVSDAASRTAVMGDAMRYLGVLEGSPPPEEPPPGEGPRRRRRTRRSPRARSGSPRRRRRSSSSAPTRPARRSSAGSTMASSRTATRRRSTAGWIRAATASGSARPTPPATPTAVRPGTAGSTCRRSR